MKTSLKNFLFLVSRAFSSCIPVLFVFIFIRVQRYVSNASVQHTSPSHPPLPNPPHQIMFRIRCRIYTSNCQYSIYLTIIKSFAFLLSCITGVLRVNLKSRLKFYYAKARDINLVHPVLVDTYLMKKQGVRSKSELSREVRTRVRRGRDCWLGIYFILKWRKRQVGRRLICWR